MLANTNAEKIKFILRNWPAYHALYEPSKANEVFRVKHETSAKRKTRGRETAPQWRNKSAHVKKILIPFVTQYQQALPGLKRILMGK